MKFSTPKLSRSLRIAALALALGAPAFAADNKPAPGTTPQPGAIERELTLINIRYGGKIIWIPSTIIVKKGETVKLNLINNVPEDPNVHGFSIPDFNVKVDVARGTPATVQFSADKAGLFETNCHLHPAHLHGQLLVIDK